MIIYLKSHCEKEFAIYKYDMDTNQACEITSTFRKNNAMLVHQFGFDRSAMQSGWTWDVLTEAEAMLELL